MHLARALRRTMSLPEVLLWQPLRSGPGGYRFRRQFPCLGYVLDFACLRARLAVEIDGEAHERGDRPARDAARDARLLTEGFVTLRIGARDVLGNMDGVVTHIVEACRERVQPNPPRNGEVARSAGGAALRTAAIAGGGRPLHPFGAPPRSGEDLV